MPRNNAQSEPDGNRIDRSPSVDVTGGAIGVGHYHIADGDRIWRPVDFKVPDGMTMLEASKAGGLVKTLREFEPADLTDRQTYMLRASHAQFHVNPDALWAFTPNVRSGGKIVSRVGLVVFLHEQITSGWTWLIVTSITRKGNALFAQSVNGDRDELFAQYVPPVADVAPVPPVAPAADKKK
jgi:hypothetical protein